MDRGWGLTLDNSDRVGFFANKPVFGVNLSPRRSAGLTMFPGRGEESPEHREVDFFAEKKVKKEDSQAEASAARDFDVNVSSCLYIYIDKVELIIDDSDSVY